jgi:dTDP-4-amino-4,6-dideoxygalactose transaminase
VFLDITPKCTKDIFMKAVNHTIDPDTKAVIDAVMTGEPLDAEAAKRIHDKAMAIRERVLREHGLVDVGVPAIREFRGQIPDA